MTSRRQRIALITPMKNEIDNLERLIECVEKQTYPIALWMVMNDNSTDGSKEYLEKKGPSIRNVERFIVVNLTQLPNVYQLGTKYSQVILAGFEQFNQHRNATQQEYDFVGILDADIFLEPAYLENLIEKFEYLPKLGIASGIIYYNEKKRKNFDGMPLRWARGGTRLWRVSCFDEAGYRVGKSADSISSALAWIKGWHCQAFGDSEAITREMGKRVDQTYYGEAAYYLHMPEYYVILKCLSWLLRTDSENMVQYMRGYHKAKRKGLLADFEKPLVRYYRYLPIRYMIETVIMVINNIRIRFKRTFAK